MFIPENKYKDILTAKLNLSGEKFKIGINDGDVWVKGKDMIEPCYMSLAECDMLIASLVAAKSQIEDDER